MTSERALEILVKQANERKLSNKIVANGIAVSLLEKLVERDTPFKVKPILNWCKCSIRVYPDEKFCKECGQRLDWS